MQTYTGRSILTDQFSVCRIVVSLYYTALDWLHAQPVTMMDAKSLPQRMLGRVLILLHLTRAAEISISCPELTIKPVEVSFKMIKSIVLLTVSYCHIVSLSIYVVLFNSMILDYLSILVIYILNWLTYASLIAIMDCTVMQYW